MAIINLTNQVALKADFDQAVEQLKISLETQRVFLNKLPIAKRIEFAKSDKSPSLTSAWDLYVYLKKYFENEEINDTLSKPVSKSAVVISR